MEFSRFTSWIGLTGLVVALAGCPGDDSNGDTMANPTTMDPTTTTNPTTGTDPTTSGSGADSTTAGGGAEGSSTGAMCDPPCEAGEVCVEGICLMEVGESSSSGGEESSSSGAPPPANSDYGPCDMCAPGESPTGIMGIEGCFCAPMCDGPMAPCPAPNEGMGMAQCALGQTPMMPTLCALLCPLGSDVCPTGATCQDTGQGIGICTHPTPA